MIDKKSTKKWKPIIGLIAAIVPIISALLYVTDLKIELKDCQNNYQTEQEKVFQLKERLRVEQEKIIQLESNMKTLELKLKTCLFIVIRTEKCPSNATLLELKNEGEQIHTNCTQPNITTNFNKWKEKCINQLVECVPNIQNIIEDIIENNPPYNYCANAQDIVSLLDLVINKLK